MIDQQSISRRLRVYTCHIQPVVVIERELVGHQDTMGVVESTMLAVAIPSTMALIYSWISFPSHLMIKLDGATSLTDVIKAYVRLLIKVPSSLPAAKLVENFPVIEIQAPVVGETSHLDNYIKELNGRSDLMSDEILPPFYLNALTGGLQLLVMSHPLFPIRLLGAVNISNKVTIHVPVKKQWLKDGELTATSRCGEACLVRQGIEFDVVTNVYRKDTLVWTMVFRSLAFVKNTGAPSSVREKHEIDPDQVKSFVFNLTQNAGRIYAKIGYDINPIHVSDLSAKLFGFPRALAHGVWVVAQAEAHSERNDIIDRDSPQVIHTVFKKPTFLPANVCVKVQKRDDGSYFTVETVDKERATIVIEGSSLQIEK
ncbi:hypothetical protein AKO1_000269 [Acrasis kona]|uniref:MaoC-like domain-containing protein n=1 Tax=Acrasis kona TaxID=1008807 RepID=A0AAW2ZE17_9EUKA